MTLNSLLITLALLIILALATVAGILHYKLYQQRRTREALLTAQAQAGLEQRERINQSIQIIAQALDNDQDLTLTEASIRISRLLDTLGVDDTVREEFSAFYQLAETTSHIPFLEGWKALSRPEQRQFDRERQQAETRFEDFVRDAARRIRGRSF